MEKNFGFLETIEAWLIKTGIEASFAGWLKGIIIVFGIFIICCILLKTAQIFIKYVIAAIAKKTASNFDDLLVEKHVFHRLAYLVPIYFVHSIAGYALKDYPFWIAFAQNALKIGMILLILFVGNSFVLVFTEHVKEKKPEKAFAVSQYLHLGRIVFWAFGIVLIVTTLLNTNPLAFFGGLTVFMSILVLVFKDSLLGFMASIQIVSHDLLRIGDWVTLEKEGTDGIVTEINLVTVKIENWDKTISSVPIYNFIANSFQNWRGMEESGVRRIKRSFFIDLNSVRFCDEAALEKYKKIQLVREYIDKKQEEITVHNKQYGFDSLHLPINGLNQTNLGIFRKYLLEYLKQNPNIASDKTLIVRQLQPTEKGLPVEIYIFSRIQAWILYEDIQSDIFDHIFASVPMFDLHLFQNPSGTDFKNISSGK